MRHHVNTELDPMLAFLLKTTNYKWLWLLQNNVLVFLHGFLGTSGDWISIMKPFSSTARCISIDLPGHGGSKVHNHGNNKANQDSFISTEVISNLLSKLIHKLTNTRVVIIGYSMGARIALQMALRYNNQVFGGYPLGPLHRHSK